jgi:hypothetical protein
MSPLVALEKGKRATGVVPRVLTRLAEARKQLEAGAVVSRLVLSPKGQKPS